MTTGDPQPQAPKPLASSRLFRRLRTQFREELLGDAKPAPSDLALIELAALAALRGREMRDAIIAGERIEDDDFVRVANAVARIMRTFRGRAATTKPKLTLLQQKLGKEGRL